MVDNLRHAVVVPVATDDDDVAGLLEELAPVLEIVGVPDDLERRLVLECGLGELPVGLLGEDDEGPNRVSHPQPPVTWLAPMTGGLGVVPMVGRSTSQIESFDDAKISCPDWVGVALRVTFVPLNPSTYMSWNSSLAIGLETPPAALSGAGHPDVDVAAGADLAADSLWRAEVDDDGPLVGTELVLDARCCAELVSRQLLSWG